jgi:hypothetical protein
MQVARRLKAHRELLLVTLFFIMASLVLVFVANKESDFRQSIGHETLEASKNICKKFAKMMSEENISKDKSLSTNDIRQGRIGCGNYLAYLNTSDDNIENLGEETMQTEETLSRLDDVLKDKN